MNEYKLIDRETGKWLPQHGTIHADTTEAALAEATRRGLTNVDVAPKTPTCNLCGVRHATPPRHLTPDSYCLGLGPIHRN